MDALEWRCGAFPCGGVGAARHIHQRGRHDVWMLVHTRHVGQCDEFSGIDHCDVCRRQLWRRDRRDNRQPIRADRRFRQSDGPQLNLQVGSSWAITQPATADNPIASYTIDPTFTLTKVPLAAAPANLTNGLLPGVSAQVTAVSANPASATITLANSATFTVTPSPTATYQGITGFSALTANEIVNMDLAIQPDGSSAATRVEVDDPASVYANIELVRHRVIPRWEPTACKPRSRKVARISSSSRSARVCCSGTPAPRSTSRARSRTSRTCRSRPISTIKQRHARAKPLGIGIRDRRQSEPPGCPGARLARAANAEWHGAVDDHAERIRGVHRIARGIRSFSGDAAKCRCVLGAGYKAHDGHRLRRHQHSISNTGMVEQGQVLRFRGVVFNDNGVLQMDCNEVLDGVTE